MTVVERTLHRQSDEKVAVEMMASLRFLIKASSSIVSPPADADAEGASYDGDDVDNDGGAKEAEGARRNLRVVAGGREEGMRRAGLRRRYHPFCGGGAAAGAGMG